VAKKKGQVHDLQNLKLAQVHSKNLKIIQEVLYDAVRGLKPFLTYRSVQRVIGTIHNELPLIEAHLNQFEKIEQTKGEIKDDDRE
jgi:hypothetical protein